MTVLQKGLPGKRDRKGLETDGKLLKLVEDSFVNKGERFARPRPKGSTLLEGKWCQQLSQVFEVSFVLFGVKVCES